MRIAIIGSGISGLVAARQLHQDHEITLFEANDYVGGHTNTVKVEFDDEIQHVDTGFIVFNELNYPGFSQLLNSLGVDSQPSCMSFSYSDVGGKFEYNGTNLNRLFAQRSNLIRPSFYRMIRDILKFGRDTKELLNSANAEQSVADFVSDHGYGEMFQQKYLLPLGAALWSCPTETFEKFPMKFVGEFLANHFMLQVGGRPKWRVVQGGSSQYIEPLTRPFADRIRTRTPVKKIFRKEESVRIVVDSGAEEFDHVVLACHADQALRLLGDASKRELETLRLFPYQKNEVFLHTDTRVLPKRKLAWASWNAKTIQNDGALATAVTYNMNMLQSFQSPRTYCVTLNESSLIRPEKLLRSFVYHHPMFTVSRTEAIEKHKQLVCHNRTSFCGAYWGFGFHEDGFQSGMRVAESINRLRENVAA